MKQNQKKCRSLRCFGWCITLMVFSAITAYYCFLNFSNSFQFKKLDQYEKNLQTNWQLKPIQEIRVVQTTACPSGFESIFNQNFPGKYNGCFCPKGNPNNFGLKMTKGKCDQTLVNNYNCTNIKAMISQRITRLQNQTMICVKRMNWNFQQSMNALSKEKGVDCLRKYKKCGNGGKDQFLCIPENLKCPIQEIKIQTTSPNKSYKGGLPFYGNLKIY